MPTAIEAELSAKGYIKVVKGARTFFFSKDGWAQEAFDSLQHLYSGIADSLDSAGLVQGDRSPNTKDFLKRTFGAYMHMGNTDSATLAARRMGMVWLTDGQKTVKVSLGSNVDDSCREALAKSPFSLAKQEPGNVDPPSLPFSVPLFGDFALVSFGYGSVDPTARTRDWAEATSILSDHYEKERKVALDAYSRLEGKVKSGADLRALERNMTSQEMPDNWKSLLSENLTGAWRSNGFGSEDEAKAFFQRCTVRSTSSLITLTGMGPNNSLVVFGLPNP